MLCAVPTTSYFWNSDRTNRLARGRLGGGYSSRIDDGDGALDCGFNRQHKFEFIVERSLRIFGIGVSRLAFLEAAL